MRLSMYWYRKVAAMLTMGVSLLMGIETALAQATRRAAPAGWPAPVREVRFTSGADRSEQPALFFAPESSDPAPLLVGLHAWSADYRNADGAAYARWCVEKKWVFIYPEFRGPNVRPEACGSNQAVSDVLSAVEFAQRQARVDANRIYLIGASGGGHMALLMAGRAPQVWAGVSAWVPITDLAAWHRQRRDSGRWPVYADHLEKVCGGPPGRSPEIDAQYVERSPLTHIARAAGVPLDINAGIHDGHTGSVPVSHSLNAFNALAEPKNRISDEDIRLIVEQQKIPDHLASKINDPAYGGKAPLFRRSAGAARVTLFEGGHEIINDAALRWLEQQRKAGP